MKADDAKRLKDLERENATLKRLLADAELEKGRVEGDRPGKLLSPERRGAAIAHLMKAMGVSERFACRVTGQNRTTQRREPTAATPADPDAALQQWLRTYAKPIRGAGSAPPITMPAARAGPSTTRRSSANGASVDGARKLDSFGGEK